MKKIIILLLPFLYFQSIFSSEKKYESVPVQKGFVEITSSDGLRQLALDKREDWNALSQQYHVLPSAIAEYLCNGNITDSFTDRGIVISICNTTRLPTIYDKLIQQIITEIREPSKKNESMLESLQQKYHDDLKQNIFKVHKQINDMLPDYNEKKKWCLFRTGCATAAALAFLGGWTAVGVFAWVWNHCHNPWD